MTVLNSSMSPEAHVAEFMQLLHVLRGHVSVQEAHVDVRPGVGPDSHRALQAQHEEHLVVPPVCEQAVHALASEHLLVEREVVHDNEDRPDAPQSLPRVLEVHEPVQKRCIHVVLHEVAGHALRALVSSGRRAAEHEPELKLAAQVAEHVHHGGGLARSPLSHEQDRAAVRQQLARGPLADVLALVGLLHVLLLHRCFVEK
eukprot:CAMPEP_0184503568 /NCGR_PEP_ID=MMETSP0113_2-20130426/51971_1 /TAXON_ID=91329 /ORGANISM="Norrisiella sphaerica, Strain BC52" /LENGTH=200 /DNA_ID=CAMNT_0026893093 /DNA_START=1289 /DNA_END=1890 /DNA_ORIENTATION=-